MESVNGEWIYWATAILGCMCICAGIYEYFNYKTKQTGRK